MSANAGAAETTISERMRQWIITFVFLFSGLIVLGDLALDIMTGGNVWQQGDWLINSHLEHVRRGILGSWILMTADLLHANPLYVLAALQATTLVMLIVCMAFVLQALTERREFYLLIASPGFFLIFWMADPQGALRKELLVYCALAFTLTYPLYRSRLTIAFATVLFIVSCLGHEANVLFLPLFAAVLFLISTDAQDQRFIRACGLIAAIGATIGLAYAVYFSRVEDVAVVCQPLTERGVPERMCKGAIKWLGYGTSDGIASVLKKFDRPDLIAIFPVMYLLALAPLSYFASLTTKPRHLYIICILSFLPILPLFMIALDWGRWLSWHVTSATFLIMAMALTGRIEFSGRATSPKLACFVLIGLLWAPGHEYGTVPGGLAARLFRDIAHWFYPLS